MDARPDRAATDAAQPAGGRDVWLSLEARTLALRWSDLVSGLLLVVFGWRSLRPDRPISLWICAGVGVWLTFASLAGLALAALALPRGPVRETYGSWDPLVR